MINLVEFDSTWGHRNDVAGYARGLSAFDAWLARALPLLRKEDLLLITADHGCDPSTPSTDHSREDVPILAVGACVRAGVDLGVRESLADVGATVLDYFGLEREETAGESLLPALRKGR